MPRDKSGGWIRLQDKKPSENHGDIVLVWHAHQGAMLCKRKEIDRNPFYFYWQPIPEDNWVDCAIRMPCRTDADFAHCVLAERRITGLIVTGWHRLKQDYTFLRWRKLPDPPGDAKELRTKR